MNHGVYIVTLGVTLLAARIRRAYGWRVLWWYFGV